MAWLLDRRKWWSQSPATSRPSSPRTKLLTLATLYWVTDSFVTSARYYWELQRNLWKLRRTTAARWSRLLTGISVFPGELIIQPKAWMESYYNLQHLTYMKAGGHFAPAEQPDALVTDIREFFSRSGPAGTDPALKQPRIDEPRRPEDVHEHDGSSPCIAGRAAEFFYDHNGPENVADRAAAHRRIAEKCPVVHSPAYDGYYIAVGYSEVSKVLRRASEFSSSETVTIPPTPMPFGMVQFDPPKVQHWRQAIGSRFTSADAEQMRAATRALVAEHVDHFAATGKAELVDDLVQPVPAISTLAHSVCLWIAFRDISTCSTGSTRSTPCTKAQRSWQRSRPT